MTVPLNDAAADTAADMDSVLQRIAGIAEHFGSDALARGQRDALVRADFDALADAGFLRLGLPAARGGLWRGLAGSARDYGRIIRCLANGDPAVALVASMHPTVLCYWLTTAEAASAEQSAWTAQRAWVFDTVEQGHWWGTLTSEPGSGGDILRTRTLAEPANAEGSDSTAQAAHSKGGAGAAALQYRLSGEKHFGSGSGVASFMTTTALVPGYAEPPTLFLDMRNVPWDGSTGLTLLQAWDGLGMRATQSHAFRMQGFPATCIAAISAAAQARAVLAPMMAVMFGAVALGVVDQAMRWARARVARMAPRAFEQTEWLRAENEAWLMAQAYEGAVRAAEQGPGLAASVAALQAKLCMAELGEVLLLRLGRVVGGASFSRSQPLGQWTQDVRALGFLRPPWGLAVDQLHGAMKLLHASGAAR